jgi:hypothetical protein
MIWDERMACNLPTGEAEEHECNGLRCEYEYKVAKNHFYITLSGGMKDTVSFGKDEATLPGMFKEGSGFEGLLGWYEYHDKFCLKWEGDLQPEASRFKIRKVWQGGKKEEELFECCISIRKLADEDQCQDMSSSKV